MPSVEGREQEDDGVFAQPATHALGFDPLDVCPRPVRTPGSDLFA